jgi:large subunit ribosomal protein L18
MKTNKDNNRQKRKQHIRKNVNGTMAKPRVFVFKSNRFFYAGASDDESNKVLMSKMSKRNEEDIVNMAKDFASDLKKKKIEVAVFDRSGYKYHGLVAAFAEGLRKNGIKI